MVDQGITIDCRVLWQFIVRDRGWWSVLRLTREWAPTYSLGQVEGHLLPLRKAGFLAAREHARYGTIYGFSADCTALPGMEHFVRAAASGAPQVGEVVPPARPDLMTGHYQPPQVSYRAGALDYAACPSLHMGKLRAFRSEAP